LKRCAQALLQSCVRQRVVFGQLFESSSDVARSEAEVPERNGEIGMLVDDIDAPNVAVRSSVGVLALDHTTAVGFGDEVTAVEGSVGGRRRG
jgi:hypothetical protein